MIKKLLEEAFEKAGKETGNETENGRAKHLEGIIQDDFKTPITARSLVRYLKKESNPKLEVRNALAKYLEYEGYEDFVAQNSQIEVNPESQKKSRGITGSEPPVVKTKRFPKIWVALSIGLAGGLTYFGLVENKECMVWVDDHYEKSECSGRALEFSLNEIELEKFRKIEVCDTTRFFKKYDPIIWYDKFNNKLEYFTYYGRNPINGRTVKPITQTIIDSHVQPCDDIEKL